MLTPVEAGGVPAEWVVPPNATDTQILYLHGGGYVLGSINTHRGLVSRIARAAEARGLVLDYRLAPEHPFPAAIEDAVAAYRFLLNEGAEPAQIAIAGDSAGGGLTLATLISLRDAGDPLPACAVTLSAWTDLANTGESRRTRADLDPMDDPDSPPLGDYYLDGVDPKHPLASPLYADLHGLPPLLMQVGTHETLHDDTIRLAEKAKAAGVDLTLEIDEGMIHVYQMYASMVPEAAGHRADRRLHPRPRLEPRGGLLAWRPVAGDWRRPLAGLPRDGPDPDGQRRPDGRVRIRRERRPGRDADRARRGTGLAHGQQLRRDR